ncbi:MAG: pyrroline-5-carboxylate reductase [Pseudoclavibacter sp.]|nr:pyrroline-5-carboxylate reductase [Pseudoclavibacter sp.]
MTDAPNTEPPHDAPGGREPQPLPPVAVLGVGNMSGAILAGLLASPFAPQAPVRTTNRSGASARALAEAHRVEALALEEDPEANARAVRDARLVVLGVKPHLLLGVLREVREALPPDAVVVSLAAGVPIAAMQRELRPGQPVVRAMPNTPAALRLGVTGVAAGAHADAEDMRLVRALFSGVGEVVEVEEEGIAAVAGVSGSGPAYVYLFMEGLIDAAVDAGLPPADARRMVEATVLGAAEMVRRSPGLEPAELRRRVTSPNGTTERALAVFQEQDLAGTVRRAVRANIRRSHELAAENG